MGFTEKQVAELSAKLSKDDVKTRTQAGRSLSYIEAWHAIAEANRIFGFDAWSSETLEVKCVSERERKLKSGADAWSVTYTAKVRVTVGDIVREGLGAGHGIDVDIGLAHESALKEAESDSRKRALMTFGNPFGLALYDKTQENVDKGEPPRQERREPSPRTQQAPQQQAADQPKREARAGTFDWQVPKRPTQIEPTWEGTAPNKTIDWAEWGGKLKHVLNRCSEVAEVQEWIKLNRGPLEGMKGEKPKWYAALMADVSKRETDLRAGATNPLAA